MQERLQAIKETLQYLISNPHAECAIDSLKQIQAEVDAPRAAEAKIDAIALILKEFYEDRMPF